MGNPTTSAYDGTSNKVSIQDPNLNTTSLAYDAQNRL